MLYLVCLLVLMFIAVSRMFGTINQMSKSVASGQIPRQWHSALYTSVLPASLALAAAAPLVSTFMDGAAASSGGVAMSSGKGSVWIAFVAASGALAYYGWPLTKALRLGNAGFGRTGALVAPTACAALLLAITGLQLEFAHHKDAGTVSFGYVRDQVHDAKCNAETVLARWDMSADKPIIYRCPTLLILNSYSTTPFVPWPDYIEGESKDLAKAVSELIKDARKPDA